MSDDLDFFGLEIARDFQRIQAELTKKREQVLLLTEKNNQYINEMEQQTMQMDKLKMELKEGKAQLQVRSEATHRLEQHNSNLRDVVAKLRVQVESNAEERERLLIKFNLAERERVDWKGKCQELEESMNSISTDKEQCLRFQNQLKNTTNKIITQQENMQRDLGKAERCAQDAIALANEMLSRCRVQEIKANELRETVAASDKIFTQLAVALSDCRRERDQLLRDKSRPDSKDDEKYYILWDNYQKDTKKRIEFFIVENQRLSEELKLVREQSEIAADLNKADASLGSSFGAKN